MLRPFFSAVLALILISFFNSANPEDKATGVSPSPAVTTEAPAPMPPAAAQPEKPVEIPPVEVKPEEEGAEALLDDSLPVGAVTQGTWEWDTSLKYSGEKSHTQPEAKGLTEYSYRAAPVDAPEDCLLEQYVYLDPKKVPAGIMLRFTFEADGKESDIGVYREGEEEVFVFNDDEPVIYDGTLPEAGKWEKWTIDPNDLGLKGAKITGISFIVYGGKANWDLTRFVPSKKPNN
ncbi:MAG: hypothetical protein A3F87_02955 [Omnitrophica WOR_2 bacterium RIFCSPLOWO2_12_FULL_51_24]|nr:MAG: hypothetical protein A3I43_04590 [Omnitrophica WOR_2 bacterium RIFCSPLOWO2_02_FULL_50_19]OGX42011.1 MAG: hypothetical protein A3F87_02955 [Omnitrophica WOR_2 bacterium RIFCSPLOWO2_12_FULL_51_24]